VHQRHGVVVPDLDSLVPGGGNDDWVLGVMVELDSRDPVGVGVFLNSEFALSDGVPDLQSLVSSSGSDLSVIGGHVNGEHVSGVSNKSLSSFSLL
jgi:hypothetical protein